MNTEMKVSLIFIVVFAAVYLAAFNRTAISGAISSIKSGTEGEEQPEQEDKKQGSWVYAPETQMPSADPTETRKPDSPFTEPFIILKDDGADEDVFGDIAYMGSRNYGDDGSISVDVFDTSEKMAGNASVRFTYEAVADEGHWAGAMFLFAKGAYTPDPGARGPDLNDYTKMTFYVKGSGGSVLFFIECDGGPQSTEIVTLTDEWTQVTLDINDTWKYVNVMFGWSCNQNNIRPGAPRIEFWVDDLRYE